LPICSNPTRFWVENSVEFRKLKIAYLHVIKDLSLPVDVTTRTDIISNEIPKDQISELKRFIFVFWKWIKIRRNSSPGCLLLFGAKGTLVRDGTE
jgi:hypothetical protein